MVYPVTRQPSYDFADESYNDSYPQLHKYPATMLPQIGIQLLNELGISSGILFDPYCGSGSSFAAGLDVGIVEMYGYDMNPLAVLISRAKFTLIDLVTTQQQKHVLIDNIYNHQGEIELLQFFNGHYWFSDDVLRALSVIDHYLNHIVDESIKVLFQVAFAETLRYCSYTRNGEFKLYRIPKATLEAHDPDVYACFRQHLESIIDQYKSYYFPRLKNTNICISDDKLPYKEDYYDVVLTSPPYGDSQTTVAYGQFSRFANEWLGVKHARKIDKMLMGGLKTERLYRSGTIADAICEIDETSHKRALEVSAFYFDLEKSIKQIARTLKTGGKAIYVVGNRRVKNVQLPTDQFIAEKFEEAGFTHLFTYERIIGNKVMPSQNSPSNAKGATADTMSQEFIVVCEKISA